MSAEASRCRDLMFHMIGQKGVGDCEGLDIDRKKTLGNPGDSCSSRHEVCQHANGDRPLLPRRRPGRLGSRWRNDISARHTRHLQGSIAGKICSRCLDGLLQRICLEPPSTDSFIESLSCIVSKNNIIAPMMMRAVNGRELLRLSLAALPCYCIRHGRSCLTPSLGSRCSR